MAKATYKGAGVDLDLYRQSMARLPGLMHRTFSPRVIRLDGGFAGLFQLDFQSPLFRRTYDDPVLVSCTDGVGTKLKLATMADVHHTVGIDLVAMSVNDAICCGAEPLFFLDYVAMSHDDPVRLEQIVRGVSQGCVQADCALLGGETAIMPDLYARGDYDLAGFCVGVVERKHLITGQAIDIDDRVLGLASSGLHSNGYSLARQVVFEIAQLQLHDRLPNSDQTVQQVLLEPTRIYAAAVKQALNHYKVKNVVHGIAHITGGGLAENLQRIVPQHVDVHIDHHAWPVPAVFPWLQQLGQIDDDEMRRVFNMGIGLALVVSPFYANRISQRLQHAGYDCYEIGYVSAGSGQVRVS
jgi:phosphoribosylformylglycinamidine cyclo-ligase